MSVTAALTACLPAAAAATLDQPCRCMQREHVGSLVAADPWLLQP